MKAAVVALAVLLRLAVTAMAADAVRAPLPPAPAFLSTDVIPVATPPAGNGDTHPEPDAAKSEAAKPEVAKPEVAKPEAAKPEGPQPEPAKAHGDDARRDSAHSRICFNAAQTRENVATHRLAEPFRALRVGGQQGEALRAKLCRWKQDQWIYEISVLRRDGHIIRLYMNAQNGQSVGALDNNDRH